MNSTMRPKKREKTVFADFFGSMNSTHGPANKTQTHTFAEKHQSKCTLKMCLNTTYFAENWKHYSKIIFKYVNNAVEPIFNENFVEKRGL